MDIHSFLFGLFLQTLHEFLDAMAMLTQTRCRYRPQT